MLIRGAGKNENGVQRTLCSDDAAQKARCAGSVQLFLGFYEWQYSKFQLNFFVVEREKFDYRKEYCPA